MPYPETANGRTGVNPSESEYERANESTPLTTAFVHTDFRVYWPARLRAAWSFLAQRAHRCRVIEIAGLGSPYAFASQTQDAKGTQGGCRTEGDSFWQCLFPDRRMESIPASVACRAVWGALDQCQPDVVFSGAIAYPSGAAAVRWARACNRRVVIMDNARLVDVPRSALVNWVKRCIYANVDALLLPAPSHIADYEFWGVARTRMFFGVNAADNKEFAWRAADFRSRMEAERAQLGLPRRFLLGIGRQVTKKNWDALLRAWARAGLTDSAPKLGLVLVGNGPERARLESLSRELGFGNVQFRDFVPPAETPRYYALASGLVLPSLAGETWGLVVNEAMACGLPVLVSRQCGCASTLVEPGRNGWLVDATDVHGLAQVLTEFAAAPPDRLAQMGEESKRIIADWGLERFCQGVWDAIQYVRSAPPRHPTPLDHFILRLWKGRYRPT